MKIKTEPEVYIIGRPSFDYGNASIFLERNGLSNHMLEEMAGTDAGNDQCPVCMLNGGGMFHFEDVFKE